MVFVINIIKRVNIHVYAYVWFFLPLKEVATWVLDYDFFSTCFYQGCWNSGKPSESPLAITIYYSY